MMIPAKAKSARLIGMAALTAWCGSSGAAVYTIADINTLFTVPVYSENFDSPSNTNWTAAQSANGAAAADSTVNHGYHYAAGGTVGPFTGVAAIPSAPSLGGTSTHGVLLSAQDVDDAGTDLTQGIAIFAQNTPVAPTTPYAIRFDLWVNYLTGAGSSEFAFWGAGATGSQTSIGTLSSGVTGTGAPPPPAAGTTATAGLGPVTTGITFTATGDGGFGRDLRVYNGTAEEIVDTNYLNKSTLTGSNLAIAAQDAGLPVYTAAFGDAGGVNNVPGNRWLDITLVYDGIDLTSYINGQPIWSKTTAFSLEKAFAGYMDVNSSVSAASIQTFAIVDNFRIVTVPEPTSGLLALGAAAGWLPRRRRNA